MSKGIFVGSFDPWHNGHSDRLENALKIFDEVKIVVLNNEKKSYWFNQKERINLIKKVVEKYKNKVEVINGYDKMIHDICHELKIFNVYRGMKAGRTFDEEIRLQVAVKKFSKDEYNEDVVFVYDITTEEDFRGASIVKNLLIHNKSIEKYVPSEIIGNILKKYKEIKNKVV